MNCIMPGFPVLHHLPEVAQTHAYWVSDAIQPSHPLFSPSLPAFNLSSIRIFSNKLDVTSGSQSTGASALASILLMNIQDWFQDWLVWFPCSPRDSQEYVEYHNSKSSILWCSALFMVQLSHPYMTNGKTITMTIETFVSKVILIIR